MPVLIRHEQSRKWCVQLFQGILTTQTQLECKSQQQNV